MVMVGDYAIADCEHGGDEGAQLNSPNDRYSSGSSIAVGGHWIDWSGALVRCPVRLWSSSDWTIVGD